MYEEENSISTGTRRYSKKVYCEEVYPEMKARARALHEHLKTARPFFQPGDAYDADMDEWIESLMEDWYPHQDTKDPLMTW